MGLHLRPGDLKTTRTRTWARKGQCSSLAISFSQQANPAKDIPCILMHSEVSADRLMHRMCVTPLVEQPQSARRCLFLALMVCARSLWIQAGICTRAGMLL